jgi:hypothetical protein
MSTNQRLRVREWIEAERLGRTEEADLHFRLVAGILPALAPPPGFAAAVLARLRPGRSGADVWDRWWMRAVVAVCVLSAGAAGALLPLRGWIDAGLTSFHAVAWGLGQAAAGLQVWVASALVLWSGLAHAAAVVGRHLAGPAPLTVLGFNLIIAAGALVALRRLMPLQEN